jgi:hypothetical protein
MPSNVSPMRSAAEKKYHLERFAAKEQFVGRDSLNSRGRGRPVREEVGEVKFFHFFVDPLA